MLVLNTISSSTDSIGRHHYSHHYHQQTKKTGTIVKSKVSCLTGNKLSANSTSVTPTINKSATRKNVGHSCSNNRASAAMSTMGWQFQHQHAAAAQCNAHPVTGHGQHGMVLPPVNNQQQQTISMQQQSSQLPPGQQQHIPYGANNGIGAGTGSGAGGGAGQWPMMAKTTMTNNINNHHHHNGAMMNPNGYPMNGATGNNMHNSNMINYGPPTNNYDGSMAGGSMSANVMSHKMYHQQASHPTPHTQTTPSVNVTTTAGTTTGKQTVSG